MTAGATDTYPSATEGMGSLHRPAQGHSIKGRGVGVQGTAWGTIMCGLGTKEEPVKGNKKGNPLSREKMKREAKEKERVSCDNVTRRGLVRHCWQLSSSKGQLTVV